MLNTLGKLISAIFIFSNVGIISAQNKVLSGSNKFKVEEIDNSFFKNDKFWRGADGAATVALENGKILWLFSDTFIDTAGTGKRSNSVMINNTLAVQDGNDLQKSKLTFYWKGGSDQPKSFFELPGETWFWTGHGIAINSKLVIFLFEEKSTSEGFGFESVGWTVAIIDNPNDNPEKWKIKYVKGPETFGVIVGSSAVLKDSNYVYLIGSNKLSKDLNHLSERINDTYTQIGLDYTFDDENDPNQFYYRSDHYNFAKNNIPVIFYFSGVHDDYHKPTDTVEKIDLKKTVRISRLIFMTAWEIANREERLKLDKQ